LGTSFVAVGNPELSKKTQSYMANEKVFVTTGGFCVAVEGQYPVPVASSGDTIYRIFKQFEEKEKERRV
jgi:hypothetical protein